MPKSKNRQKKKPHPIQRAPKAKKTQSFRDALIGKFRDKRIPSALIYNYHTRAFNYFHKKIGHLLKPSNTYRKLFWSSVTNGRYDSNQGQELIKKYKNFLEDNFQKFIKPYSVEFWIHVSRRIAPGTMGIDDRPETIMICRNIITAAIQKYGILDHCGNLRRSDELTIGDVFNGLFLLPEFASDLKFLAEAPPQLVLTNFDENNLLEYYELERLAYEMWLAGSKSRILAKGANLIVNNGNQEILFDDRTQELGWLINNYDNREMSMSASATGAVFLLPDIKAPSTILLVQILSKRLGKAFSDPITEHLELTFMEGQFPNYEFCQFDIKTYLTVHQEFAIDFENKWKVNLNYVVAVLTNLLLDLMVSVIHDKDTIVACNAMFRAYRIFKKQELKDGILENWKTTTDHLGVYLKGDSVEIEKAIAFLSLTKERQTEIFIDSFGPLKVFLPATNDDDVLVDHSIIGDILYNLFAGLPLKDRGAKGELLEWALKSIPSYLPTTESKGLDGTAKQVDYSVAKGDILVLAECKAIARSFGIFGGQAKAIDHRLKNVINKGLDDVDAKVQWFLTHKQGTNYDISGFKFIVGIAVSAFTEFIPSKDAKYWLNDNVPRVLTIDEFEKLMNSNLHQTITKNLIPLS
ncbi:hypothetical protein ACFGVS_14390 [Mucilaginibacter sp. AW1-7]|uniref:hypothetical protein n=1 Tax=Mucilaginibacter sp. AW1-7 TaxID=3349874 RepID=UPI003F739C49